MPIMHRCSGRRMKRSIIFCMRPLLPPSIQSLGANEWVALALKTGEINLRAMELLDAANTGAYGHPVPTKVPLGVKKGKAILVSGHDLEGPCGAFEADRGEGHYCVYAWRDAALLTAIRH